MNIEIAKHARMSERGSSLLRLIQNNDMPILDLLVREAIQNSLDASLPGYGYTNVDFNISSFNSYKLSSEFEGITEGLKKKFHEEKQQLIEIRDTNTTGLTGPIHYDEVNDCQFGNLLKLIYEISMPQQQEGAGGSWGLGKTVYFRVGIGLVIYYSQIETDSGEYASRMAACLVEDENKEDSLIDNHQNSLKRGIAWWGKGIGDGTTVPLTNIADIERVLSIMNIKPFEEGETGTSIIIPYIKPDELLEGILPSNGNEENKEFSNIWWMDNIKDYIKVAVQRWYAPRLMNKDYYYGRWLRTRINGEGIKRTDMLPFFRIVQGLYNLTPISKRENEELLNDSEATFEEVRLRNVFSTNTCAGYIAYAKVSRKELLMNYPHNHQAPYTYINKFDRDMNVNDPILMFTRKPGMIVGYETSGYWTDSIPKSTDGEFIVGLFVVNSANELRHTDPKMTLEEYIRKSEKADHTSWNDGSINAYKPNIVSKIQNQVKQKLSNKFTKRETENTVRKNIGLGKALAEVLLPPENFGKKGNASHQTSRGGESINKSKGFGLKVLDSPEFIGNDILLDFEITSGRMTDSLSLELIVQTESGAITANRWEHSDGIGKAFPIRIKSVIIYKYKKGKQAQAYELDNMYIDMSIRNCNINDIAITTEVTERFNIDYGMKIVVPEKSGYTFFGKILFEINDSQVQAGLNLVEVGGEHK